MSYSALIKGAKWKFQSLSVAKYVEKHGEEEWASVDKDNKCVTFCEGKFSIGLCRHEVYHAHMAECCTGSIPKCDPVIMEEITAELLENHWDDINKIAQSIFKSLR